MDLQTYLQFSQDLAEIVQSVEPDQLHVPVAEDKWTVFQLLQHITDSEIVYFRRIKRVLVEDNPQLLKWHPTEWIAMEPADLDVSVNLAIVKGVRTKLYNILSVLAESDWQRPVVHPRYGPMDLASLVRQQVDHATGHLTAIRQFANDMQ